MAGKTGVPIVIDTKQFSALTRGIRATGAAGALAVRGALRDSAELVKVNAAGRVSYSSRIAGSLKARATSVNFKVSAGGDAAPNAAPIENKGKGFVRHPTYSPRPGVPERVGWTDKNSHPAFLSPALEDETEAILELIADRLATAIHEALGARL
jgi:hypothetical protein